MRKLLPFGAVFAGLMLAAASPSSPAQLGLRRGMSISEAHTQLMKNGWAPVRIDKKLADGERENLEAEARLLFDAGFFEVEYCTGTGRNLCFFNYQRNGECVRVITEGEYFSATEVPILATWNNQCPD